MRKSILSASIAAMIGGLGFAGLANAAIVTPTSSAATTFGVAESGVGNVLFVPYFTTQGTNATLLNITNTDTVNGKAVKIRFRGASNSDDIFDFTLLMSPGDVWAAKISQGADGRSQLETSDKSCTLPAAVATQRNSFPTNRLRASLTDAQKANETREGYIEILTMANIPQAGNNNQGTTAPAVNPLFTATKHVNGVAPCTVATLDGLRTDITAGYNTGSAGATTTSAQGKGLDYPTTGLMANWTIIDTVKTATFSGAAFALRAGDNTGTQRANIVFWPQSDDPVTGTFAINDTAAPNTGTLANINRFTADPLLRTTDITKSKVTDGTADVYATGTATTPVATSPIVAAAFYDLPDLSTPYLAGDVTNTTTPVSPAVATTGANLDPFKQAYRLTSALATVSVVNEYLTTTSIAATTDWVFSMPTRRYNVAMNYGYASPVGGDGRVYSDWGLAGGSNVNFFTSANTSVVNGQICVAADSGNNGVNQWDREETTTSSQFVISPGTVTNVRFCGETSVLAINNGTNTSSGSLNASVALQNLNVNSNEGWIRLGTSGISNRGLPVLGAAFAKSSAFGAVWPHRYSR